jgi:hypothetical protein
MIRSKAASLVVVTLLVVSACGTVPDRNPIPERYGDAAEIPGIPNARHWGDAAPPLAVSWMSRSRGEIRERFSGILGREHHYLALSGGGENGAFGAGLLTGWTESGTRPEFTVVTGISTGALLAPFAFLGPKCDPQLEVYTQVRAEDILKPRTMLQTITSDAAASSKPLKKLIAAHIDEEFLEAVAVEHRKGRRLYLGTTNLDADRPVIWDMGRIAESGAPAALELFRSVMLASASIPGAFPPVLIEVAANGKRYDEIHVDGGTTTQVFLVPVGLDMRLVEQLLEVRGAPNLYIVRNGRLVPEWKTTEAKFIAIAGRSISSLIRTQGVGDVYRLYLQAVEGGMEFHLACIPADFDVKSEELFDPRYMRALFDRGRQMAKKGYPWKRKPPGLDQY